MTKIKKHYEIIFIMLLSLIPKLLYSFRALPFNVLGDEIWTLASAAKLAGLNWEGALVGGRYYGMGFFSLFAPLFNIIDNPNILYKIMVTTLVLISAVIPLVAYYILSITLQVKTPLVRILLSVAMSYFIYWPIVMVYNEHIYIVLWWIIIFCFIKLLEYDNNKKKKNIYTLLLVLTMMYSYTIHARATALWAGIVIGILLYKIAYKKWVVSPKIFFVAAILAYVGIQFFINKQINWLWSVPGAGSISNSSAYSGGIHRLFDPAYWQAIVSIGIGQIFAGNAFSGGILVPLIVLAFVFIFKGVSKKKRESVPKELFLISAITIIVCLITIGGQAISWSGGVKPFLDGNPAFTDSSRAISYLRYYMAYVGPFFLTGIVYCSKNKGIVKRYVSQIVIIDIVILGIWLAYIYPHICYGRENSTPYFAFSLQSIRATDAGMSTYLPAVILMVVLSICWFVLMNKKQFKVAVIILAIFMCYKYCYYAETIIINEERRQEIITSIDKEINLEKKEDIPKILYVNNDRELTDLLQYYLPQKEIINNLDNLKNDKNTMIFSKEKIKGLDKYKEKALDKKLYIYYLN